MEEELSGFQVDPAVSDGTRELGRRSGKEFDQQVERKDLYSDRWWYCAQSGWTLCNPVQCSLLGSLSMESSRQEYQSGLPFPTPGDLADPGIRSLSPVFPYHCATWELPTGDIQLWSGSKLRVSHLLTQSPRPKCLPFVKEEVCRKSGFLHWFSLLLRALRFGFFFFF